MTDFNSVTYLLEHSVDTTSLTDYTVVDLECNLKWKNEETAWESVDHSPEIKNDFSFYVEIKHSNIDCDSSNEALDCLEESGFCNLCSTDDPYPDCPSVNNRITFDYNPWSDD